MQSSETIKPKPGPVPGKRSGGKNVPSAVPSNKTEENSPKGRSWKNKAVMIGVEIGCLTSENHARDSFRECLTNRVLELKTFCI